MRQNTGKEKQSKKELPDIQTGSFHIHYCIFKRQVFNCTFVQLERRDFFFSFFGLFSSVHECFFILISADGQTDGHYSYVEC